MKIPKVRIVRGSVRIKRIGLSKTFTSPQTKATRKAVYILSTLIPGINQVQTRRAKAVVTHVNIIFIIPPYYIARIGLKQLSF